MESLKDLTYTGGNNGTQFAQFLADNDLLVNDKFCDYYFDLAKQINYTHANFPKWILNDSFWEDFAYSCENELNILIAY